MAEGPERPLRASGHEEWKRWRARTLTGLLRTTGFVCSALGLFATVQVHSVPFAAVSAVVALLMLLAAVRQAMPFRLRATILLIGLYGASTAAMSLGGLSPNILVAMSASVVMATLLLGRRWGIAMTLACATTVAVVMPLRNAGLLPVDLRITYEHPDGRTLARVVFAFVLLASAVVASVSYLLSRAEEVFLQKAHALETLEQEQARRRETDEQLRRTEAAFHKARELEVLGRLSSSVAHDFNNALLILQANVDLARRRPSYVATALSHIEAAVFQATATTRQLRAFTPAAQQPARPLHLGETLAREGELLQRILPENIEVKIERPDADLTVLGDEGQIQSLLTNFALNARDAMPDGGTLTMRLRPATPSEGADGRSLAVVDIEDNGVGMSRETAARIFEPFFTTKGAAGTGLGLASARGIVEKAGGRIEVTSELGKGTRFRILWPLYDGAPSSTHERKAGDGADGAGTVLVVEDDDAVRSAITEPLSWRGYTVLEARTGDDALLVARRHHEPIDVVCVDYVLPGMPTRELVSLLRASHPAVRVLLCSGYLPEDAAPALDLDAFLPKPFSPDVLARVVRKLVGGAI
jgi:signal transduction histidine kinase